MKPAMRDNACAPARAPIAASHISVKLPRHIGCGSWPKNSSSSASAMACQSLPYCTGETRTHGDSSVAGAMPAAASSAVREMPRASAQRTAASTMLTEIESRSMLLREIRVVTRWRKRSVSVIVSGIGEAAAIA